MLPLSEPVDQSSWSSEIDQLALDLLAMEQPMAVDLRFILSRCMRINADLERMGDQAVNIAVRVARDAEHFTKMDLPIDVSKLASLAAGMVRKALRSPSSTRDEALAREVLTAWTTRSTT